MIDSIFWYFFTKVRVVLVCFGLFHNSVFRLFRFYTKTESFDVSIQPKQTEDQPKQFDREHILVFFRKFRVVLVCFSLFRTSSVCFSCFDIGSKHRNKPKFFVFGFGSIRIFFVCFEEHPITEHMVPVMEDNIWYRLQSI